MTVLVLAVAVAGWVVVPGCALAAATAPAHDDPWAFTGRAVALGTGTWVLGSQLVMETVGLSPATSWSACGVVSLGSSVAWWSTRRRRGGGLPRPRHLAGGDGRARAVPWWAGPATVGAVLVAGMAVWAPVLAVNVRSSDALLHPTPWYYWGLAEQTASTGSLPTSAREWGTTVDFLADYPGFTSGTVVLIQQVPGEGFEPARAVMVVTTAAAVLGLASLVAALGGRTTGLLVASAGLVSMWIFAIKLASYRPEPTGYGLMFAVGALSLRWMREGERGALVAGGVSFVALGQVHGIDQTLAGVLALAAVACSLLVDRDGLGPVARAALPLGSWIVAWVAWTLALTGRISTADAAGGLVTGRSQMADPTWAFVRAIQGEPLDRPPSAADLAESALARGIAGVDDVAFFAGVVVVVLALLAWAVVGRGEDGERARRTAVWCGVVGVGVAAFCTWFGLRWDTYVPLRTGFSRMLQVTAFLVPLSAAMLASMGGRVGRGVAALVVGATVSVVAVAVPAGVEVFDRQRPSAEAIALYRSLDLPPDSVVLTNAYTEGIVTDVLGAEGLLEGRAPYTFPGLLGRAVGLLRGAASFFADPEGHRAFLVENGVTHVLAAKPRSYALGTPARFGWRVDEMARVPELRLVARTPELALFEVRR
ncbi:MAG: hypothetical protein AB7L84_02720 [Acidimicrobiia bacterium]